MNGIKMAISVRATLATFSPVATAELPSPKVKVELKVANETEEKLRREVLKQHNQEERKKADLKSCETGPRAKT